MTDEELLLELTNEIMGRTASTAARAILPIIRRHRLAERAAIVAWLRGDEPYPDGHDIAAEIEAGEHLT